MVPGVLVAQGNQVSQSQVAQAGQEHLGVPGARQRLPLSGPVRCMVTEERKHHQSLEVWSFCQDIGKKSVNSRYCYLCPQSWAQARWWKT